MGMKFNPQPKPIKGIKKGFKPNLDSIYKILKARKLLENPDCEARLDGCIGKAQDLDHTAGRNGVRLIIYEWFKSVCRHCHTEITKNTSKYIESGYCKSRGSWDVMSRVRWIKDNLSDYLTNINIKV